MGAVGGELWRGPCIVLEAYSACPSELRRQIVDVAKRDARGGKSSIGGRELNPVEVGNRMGSGLHMPAVGITIRDLEIGGVQLVMLPGGPDLRTEAGGADGPVAMGEGGTQDEPVTLLQEVGQVIWDRNQVGVQIWVTVPKLRRTCPLTCMGPLLVMFP